MLRRTFFLAPFAGLFSGLFGRKAAKPKRPLRIPIGTPTDNPCIENVTIRIRIIAAGGTRTLTPITETGF